MRKRRVRNNNVATNACVKLSRYRGGVEDETARKEKERPVRNSNKIEKKKI